MSPNQQQQNTLSGSVLKSQNVDAGMRVVIPDCRGQSLWYWDSGENERRWEYDRLRRLKKIYEKSSSHAEICSEKLRYGDAQQDVKIKNSIGFLIEHYDTAGCRLISRYSLQGQPKEETRFFLKSDEVIDWTKENQKNQRRLESNEYISRWAYNALGEVIQQSDAATNERKTHYGVDAQVSKKILRIKGKEQTLTQDRVYLANGQLQQENINYINTAQTLTWDSRNQLKKTVQVERETFQDNESYVYDSQGNRVQKNVAI